MRIPDEVKIGPFTYRVVVKDDLRNDDNRRMFGEIRYSDHIISLWSGLTPCRKPVTFLHEVLHGLSDLTRADLREKQIDRLAPALMAFLQDNGFLKDDG